MDEERSGRRELSVDARGVEVVGAGMVEGVGEGPSVDGGGPSRLSRLERKSRASSAFVFFPLAGMASLERRTRV